MLPHGHRADMAFVFDLDDVLLPTSALFHQDQVREWLRACCRSNDHQRVLYGYQRVVHPNPSLIHYLHQLQGPKFVLTNASRLHAEASLRALGVRPHMVQQIDADDQFPLKPHIQPYTQMHGLVQQHLARQRAFPIIGDRGPSIVFFDDRVENHVAPKQLGWTTVWVYGAVPPEELARQSVIPAFVDVAFATVEEALRYFVGLQQQRRGG